MPISPGGDTIESASRSYGYVYNLFFTFQCFIMAYYVPPIKTEMWQAVKCLLQIGTVLYSIVEPHMRPLFAVM